MFTDKYMGSTTQTVDSFVLGLKTPSQKPGIFFWGGRGCRLPPLPFALSSTFFCPSMSQCAPKGSNSPQRDGFSLLFLPSQVSEARLGAPGDAHQLSDR